MKNEITIEEVKEFIRKYGYKYSMEIKEELNKIRVISDEEIKEEMKRNYELYKRMSDM